MQLKLPFRVVRGLTVLFAIVFAHFALAWLFNTLRVPMPEFGPVIATLLGDTRDASTDVQPGAATSGSEPSAVQASIEAPARAVPANSRPQTAPVPASNQDPEPASGE